MTITEYEACTDCRMHIGTGEHSEFDLAFEPSRHAKRLAEILAGIGALSHHALDMFAGERIEEFSKFPCDICRTTDAGERYQVTGVIR